MGNGYGNRQQSFGQGGGGEPPTCGKCGKVPSVCNCPAPLAKSPAAGLVGAYREPLKINQALAQIAEQCHLLSPASTVGTIPEGCEVVLSSVSISSSDTYSVRGGMALKKTAIDLIAAALGVSWVPQLCYRYDDASDANYVHFKVAGTYKSFDGQTITLTGEKIMDLRDGSAMATSMKTDELKMARSHILSHAESKAKNRATRSIGLRPAYSQQDLQKPFICARMMFTGRTEDPVLKQQFASDIARSFMSGHSALYGNEPRQLPTQAAASNAPPPVNASRVDDDDAIPTHGEPVQGKAPAAAPQAEQWTVQVEGKPVPITDAPTLVLQRAIDRVAGDLADGLVPPEEIEDAKAWRKALQDVVAKRGDKEKY